MRVLALLLLTLFAFGAKAEQVRIGTEGAFPPYNFLDRAGTLRGFDIDVGTEICARASLSCSWVLNDWDTMIAGLLAGKYDAMMAGMAATPGRAGQMLLSEGYEPEGEVSALFIARHDYWNNDPSDALVAVQLETIHEDFLKARGLRFVTYATMLETVEAVWAGSADMAFGSTSFLESAIQNSGGVLREVAYQTLVGGATVAGFRPTDPHLKTKFDAAIRSMKADGTLERLSQKWFSAGHGTY